MNIKILLLAALTTGITTAHAADEAPSAGAGAGAKKTGHVIEEAALREQLRTAMIHVQENGPITITKTRKKGKRAGKKWTTIKPGITDAKIVTYASTHFAYLKQADTVRGRFASDSKAPTSTMAELEFQIKLEQLGKKLSNQCSVGEYYEHPVLRLIVTAMSNMTMPTINEKTMQSMIDTIVTEAANTYDCITSFDFK